MHIIIVPNRKLIIIKMYLLYNMRVYDFNLLKSMIVYRTSMTIDKD